MYTNCQCQVSHIRYEVNVRLIRTTGRKRKAMKTEEAGGQDERSERQSHQLENHCSMAAGSNSHTHTYTHQHTHWYAPLKCQTQFFDKTRERAVATCVWRSLFPSDVTFFSSLLQRPDRSTSNGPSMAAAFFTYLSPLVRFTASRCEWGGGKANKKNLLRFTTA